MTDGDQVKFTYSVKFTDASHIKPEDAQEKQLLKLHYK